MIDLKITKEEKKEFLLTILKFSVIIPLMIIL